MINGLPEKLKALRKQYNYTQKYVAHILRISPAIISAYETGERTPSAEILLGLAKTYHCTTDYLLGRDKKSIGLFVDISDLSEKEITLIIDLIDALKKKV